MHIPVPFHFNTVRELERMIRALAYSSGVKYPSGRRLTRSTFTRLAYHPGR
jgi:hypothetical protein